MTAVKLKPTRWAALLITLGTLGAFALDAADTPAPQPAPPPGGGGPGPGRPGRGLGGGGNPQGPRGNTMGLDDEQFQLYREANLKNSEELRKLDEKLRAAQKELVQVALAEKYDEKAVRDKAEAVARIQVDIATLRAKALATVAPTLKPEQRDQLENSPSGAALLMGGGMGGGRFGGGAGPGGGPPPGRRGPGGQ